MTKYITYCRVSVDENKTGSVSLQWQRETIAQWLFAKGAVASLELVDNGVSAAQPLSERPAGKALSEFRKGHEATIICAKVDRAFRSIEDMAVTVRKWGENGVAFVSVIEGFDPTTTFGWFQMALMCAFAELERRMIGDRIRAGIKTRKDAGQRYSTQPPYGFREEGVQVGANGVKSGGLLVPDDTEQKVIRTIKAWRDRGLSLQKIADALNAEGIPTRKGGPWIHTMVQKILVRLKESSRGKKKSPVQRAGTSLPELATHSLLEDNQQ